jgi:hypothetical protein
MKRRPAGVLVAVMAVGCDGSVSRPTGLPAPPPITYGGPSVPTGPYTISGTVTEGARSVPGANVSAFLVTASLGYSYMWAHGAVVTDVNGQFRMTSVPADARVWFQTWKDGYVHQCAAPQITVHGDTTVDLALVSRAALSASSSQPAVVGSRTVSGVVVETTPTGKQPMAGVGVDFEPLEDFPAAITYSDAGGRFLLCGLPRNETVKLGAGIGGRVAYVNVAPDQSTDVEITLP